MPGSQPFGRPTTAALPWPRPRPLMSIAPFGIPLKTWRASSRCSTPASSPRISACNSRTAPISSKGKAEATACGGRRSPSVRPSTARSNSYMRGGPYPIVCSPRGQLRSPSKPRKRSRSASPAFGRPNAARAPNQPPTIPGASRVAHLWLRRRLPKSVGPRGHHNLAQKGTFQNCVDRSG